MKKKTRTRKIKFAPLKKSIKAGNVVVKQYSEVFKKLAK